MAGRAWRPLIRWVTLLLAVPAVAGAARAAPDSVCGVARIAGVAAETATPVVLVHGIQSSPEVWKGEKSTSMAGRIGSIPGFAVFGFDYRHDSLSWVTDPAIGPLLAKTIVCLAVESGRKVVVVAHSMGGLATRFAATRPDGPGRTVSRHIARVVTLGTPFAGAQPMGLSPGHVEGGLDLAALAGDAGRALRLAMLTCGLRAEAFPQEGACGELRVPDTEAGRALRPGSAELARLPAWPAGTVVHSMAGEVGRLSVEVAGRRVESRSLGDGIVPAGSALAGGTEQFVDECVEPGSLTLDNVMSSRCSHTRLPADPILIDEVVRVLRQKTIAAVDWQSGWFVTDCGGIAPAPKKTSVAGGAGHAAADGAYSGGYDITVADGAAGDLTGDQVPEAAVLVTCVPRPSNFARTEVHVFTGGGARLGVLPRIDPLPAGLPLAPQLKNISIDDGVLRTDVSFYAGADNHADGPSVHRTVEWRWDGSKFVTEDLGTPSAATPWAAVAGTWVGPAGKMVIYPDGLGIVTVASWARCDDPETGGRPCDDEDVEAQFSLTSVTATEVRARVTRSESPLVGAELVFRRTAEPREFLDLHTGDPEETYFYFCRRDDPNADVECA